MSHLIELVEFLEYVAVVGNKFGGAGTRDEKAFLELYSSYQLEYDYFDHANKERFELFRENFEARAQELESK